MIDVSRLFKKRKCVIGMVHVGALPGTPRAGEGIASIVRRAAAEARLLADEGFDAVIIENMHDRPYVQTPPAKGPEVTAVMTRVGLAVREAVGGGRAGMPVGVQVLSGGNREAIAIAMTVAATGEAGGAAATWGGAFIRCENFVFAHVADEGLLCRAEAGELLRYRKMIGADGSGGSGGGGGGGAAGVAVFCDIKKKHASHAITADVSLGEVAEAAEFFGADGVIVTGAATGKAARIDDVAEAKRATRLPVLVGSGVTPETIGEVLEHADGVIVGSSLKVDGVWSNGLELPRCRAIMKAAEKAR